MNGVFKLLGATLLAGAGMLACVTSAQSTTLNFDDLGNSFGQQVDVFYGGLNWDYMYYMTGTNVPNSGYGPGTTSPGNAAFNGFEFPASFRVTHGQTFTLNSFNLTAAWRDGLAVTVEAYLVNVLVRSTTIFPSATSAALYTFNWTGIDQIVLTPSGGSQHPGYAGKGNQFVLDDIVINEPVSSVPAPAALPLLLSGLAGIGTLARRRRRKAA